MFVFTKADGSSVTIKMPDDYLADAKWNRQFEARCRVEKAVRAEEKATSVVTIRKHEGESMNTPYQQFCELVEIEILKSETDGKPISFADGAALVNRQHPGLYRQAVQSAPAMERPAPVRPIAKSSTSGDIMLLFARRLLVDGEAKTLGEAIGKVHQQHPLLYAQHREGK